MAAPDAGPRFVVGVEDLEVFACPLGAGLAAAASLRAPGGESGNQDAAAILPVGDGAVLVVADGVGGFRAGSRASDLAVRCLAEAVGAAAGSEGLRAAILDGIEHANRAVQELGVGAATTLAAVEIQGGTVRPYHVGDSAILVVGQRGRVTFQTVAHSPVGFAVEAGVMDEGEAMHHEHRHVVSNVLGAPDMRIEVGSARRLKRFDTVLLASDGLLDNLHGDEIIEGIRVGPLVGAARRLAERALQRMTRPEPGAPSKPDDCTFVVYRPSGR